MRTPQQVIAKRIEQLRALDRPHTYDIGELSNLRASLRLMGGPYCYQCGREFIHGDAPDHTCGLCRHA